MSPRCQIRCPVGVFITDGWIYAGICLVQPEHGGPGRLCVGGIHTFMQVKRAWAPPVHGNPVWVTGKGGTMKHRTIFTRLAIFAMAAATALLLSGPAQASVTTSH